MTATRPVALVTGASSGIGKAAALTLAAAGFQVAGTSRNTSRVTPRDGVTYLDLDVASDESVTAVVKQVIERFGRLDVLVNNAGIGSAGAAEETSVAQAQSVFDVNVFGLIRMTRAVLPYMRAQGSGRIINISSETALYRRAGRRTRQHAAPHRPRPGLRQADPQAQPAGRLTSSELRVSQNPVRQLADQPGPVPLR